MAGDTGSQSTRVSRRTILSATTAGLCSAAGCVKRARSLVTRVSPEQVSLEIKATPADSDPAGVRISQLLAENLEAIGVSVEVTLLETNELYLDILINQQFDLAVLPHPGGRDPDFLRPLLHSRFSEEPGWQNPWGFTDLTIDELLNTQTQQEGAQRRATIQELLQEIALKQPFTPIVFRDFIRSYRPEKFAGWNTTSLDSIFFYLTLTPTDFDTNGQNQETLSVVITDERLTNNFNPLSVEYRELGTFTDLVYDSLIRFDDNIPIPWIATTWEWTRGQTGLVATLSIRDGIEWHDGQPLTVDDIAFTYEFIADTTLDHHDMSVPAPRYRGEVTLVEEVEVRDDSTVTIRFNSGNQRVCEQSLTIPILPRHEWEDQSALANVAGFELLQGTTEALVWDNMSPVGSGIFNVTGSQSDQWLEMTQFDAHFLTDAPPEIDSRYHGGPSFDRLRMIVAPSDEAALELVRQGEADIIGDGLSKDLVPQIGQAETLQLKVDQSRSFYTVGYNTTRAPLTNPNFRRAVAQLLDKEYITDVIFGGFASPTVDPIRDEDWSPSEFQWNGTDPVVPFAGDYGELAVDEAMSNFVDAGYQYSSEGELLTRTE